MKNSVFKKFLFCLSLAIMVCSLGAASANNVMACQPPDIPAILNTGISAIMSADWTQIVEYSAPAGMAFAAVVIPAYNLKNLKCVTADVFNELQAKHKKLYVIDVVIDKTESYQFLMRRPTRHHLEILAGYGGDFTKISDFVIKNLVVAGNNNNELDDGVVYSAFNIQAQKAIGEGESFLSKA